MSEDLFDWTTEPEKTKCEYCEKEYKNIESHKLKCKKNPDNKSKALEVLEDFNSNISPIPVKDLNELITEIVRKELAKTPKLTGLTDYDIESLEEAIRTAELAYKNKKNVGVKRFIIRARKVLENKIKR